MDDFPQLNGLNDDPGLMGVPLEGLDMGMPDGDALFLSEHMDATDLEKQLEGFTLDLDDDDDAAAWDLGIQQDGTAPMQGEPVAAATGASMQGQPLQGPAHMQGGHAQPPHGAGHSMPPGHHGQHAGMGMPADPCAQLIGQMQYVQAHLQQSQATLMRIQADEASLQTALQSAASEEQPGIQAKLAEVGAWRRSMALQCSQQQQDLARLGQHLQATRAAMGVQPDAGALQSAPAAGLVAQTAQGEENKVPDASADAKVDAPSPAAATSTERAAPGSLADAAPFGCAPFSVPAPSKKLGRKMMPRAVQDIALGPYKAAKRAGVNLKAGDFYAQHLRARRIAASSAAAGVRAPPTAALLPKECLPELVVQDDSAANGAPGTRGAARSRLWELANGVLGRQDRGSSFAPPRVLNLGEEQLVLTEDMVMGAARDHIRSVRAARRTGSRASAATRHQRVAGKYVARELQRMAELAKLRQGVSAAVHSAAEVLDQRREQAKARWAAGDARADADSAQASAVDEHAGSDSEASQASAGPDPAEVAAAARTHAQAVATLAASLPQSGGVLQTRHAAESLANGILQLHSAQLALEAETLRSTPVSAEVVAAATAGVHATLWYLAKLLALLPAGAQFEPSAAPNSWPWSGRNDAVFALLAGSPKGKRQLLRALMQLPAHGAVAAVLGALSHLPNMVASPGGQPDAEVADAALAGGIAHMMGALMDTAPTADARLAQCTAWMQQLLQAHNSAILAALMQHSGGSAVLARLLELGEDARAQGVAPDADTAWETALQALSSAVQG